MSKISQFSTLNVSTAHDKYRPVYSKEVLKSITEYMTCEGNSCFNSALDVACEFGQSTFRLFEKFQQVTCVDISKTNVKEALSRRHNSDYSNIDFMVGDPHSLPIETSSVDLLTCAMAWHLLDPEMFYAEAKRVLKPGGCLAIYGYGVHVEDNNRIKSAFKMFHDELFRTECFAEENVHVLIVIKQFSCHLKK